jgi:hypothetical protein
MTIMEEVSKVFGTYLTEKTFEREIKILDTSGRITQRKMLDLLIVIIKYLYANEKSTPV